MNLAESRFHRERGLVVAMSYQSSVFESEPYPSLFQSIPPERVGLNGEYDYNGLAKRVALALSQKLPLQEVANLHVLQRGKVVILRGEILDHKILHQVVQIARSVSGAADVETDRVEIVQ